MFYHYTLCFKIALFLLSTVDCEELVKVESDHAESSSHEVLETQHTICRIDTQEIAATAQATVTRALKGICAAKNMEEHFKRIEIMIKDQMDRLKTVEDHLYSSQKSKITRSSIVNHPAAPDNADQLLTPDLTTTKSPDLVGLIGKLTVPISTVRSNSDDKLKSEQENLIESPRDREVRRYNGTVHKEPGSKVFTYYWRVNDVMERLNAVAPTRSRSFYVTPGGYCLYLKLMPKQNGDTVYIHVGLTKGKFDEALLWPFRLKLRLHVLNQETADRRNDFVSKTWDPSSLCTQVHWQKPRAGDNHECLGLGVPSTILEDNAFIFQNLMIIKLSVYL